MMKAHHRLSKKAQVASLVIVLAVLAVLGAGAYFMSGGMGSEVTGFGTVSSCDYTVSGPDPIYYVDNLNCGSGTTRGLTVTTSDVIIDCRGNTIQDSGAGGLSRAIVIANPGNGPATIDNVTVRDCNIDGFDIGISAETTATSGGVTLSNINLTGNTISNTKDIGIRIFPYSTGSNTAIINALYITENTIDSDDSDINFTKFGDGSHSITNVHIWLNNFIGGGIGTTQYDTANFCRVDSDSIIEDEFGNYYEEGLSVSSVGCSAPIYAALYEQYDGTLPVFCGATVVGELSLSGDLLDQTGTTCDAEGLTMGANDATINCNDYHITGSETGTGVDLGSYTGTEVTNCYISNFSTGIGGTNPTSANVTQNVFSDNSNSLNIGGGSATVYNNNFYSSISSTAGTFSFNGDGNFYESSLTPEDNDVGPITEIFHYPDAVYDFPIGGQSFYNVSKVDVGWDAQSSKANLPITYHVEYDGGSGWVALEDPVSETFTSIDATGVLANESIDLRLTPYDTNYNGSRNTTGQFWISNDLDEDGYSVLFDTYNDLNEWDCNDDNTSWRAEYTHQPRNRENYTNPELADFCFDTLDNDCDTGIAETAEGGIDWLDHGCGGGFTTGSFSSELYTNGSIQNIQTSRLNESIDPLGYYVLINDTYGRIEYATETNLSGVDFDDIFTIDYNHIEGNPLAEKGDRFDKPAKITFTNLTNYHKIPILLVDGVPCPPETCSLTDPDPNDPSDAILPFEGTLSFTSNHFSTYTTANNSAMHTFTQSEDEAKAYSVNYPKEMETYHRLKFFANYTKYPSGDPVNDEIGGSPDAYNGGGCTIVLTDPFGDIITRNDYVEFYDDFNRGTAEPDWIVYNKTRLNVTAVYQDPVYQDAIEMEMLDTSCLTFNQTCYGMYAYNISEDSTDMIYNVTFRAKSNISSGANLSIFMFEWSGAPDFYQQVFNVSDTWESFSFDRQFDGAAENVSLAFYLNYTGATYKIWLDDIVVYTNGSGVMEYDDFYGLYVYESGPRDFTYPSDYYRYNISCVSEIYEPHNATARFSVVDDEDAPEKPVLYPQILLHPSNMTPTPDTYFAGYFGESDIDYTVTALDTESGGERYFELLGITRHTTTHSEYRGEDITLNFNSEKGIDTVFVTWSPDFEEALNSFDYVDFSNHNRTYFNRYQIKNVTRSGSGHGDDDIRVVLYQDLEDDVTIGTTLSLHSAPHPPGYFILNMSLFPGENRLSAWGVDQAGNPGYSSNDWINAPYPENAPVAPVFWSVPEAIRLDEDLELIGFINETTIGDNLNLTFMFWQDEWYNYVWNNTFNESTNYRDSTLTADATEGQKTFRINSLDYEDILAATSGFPDLWVDFSNHNRTYWSRYNVTGASKPFGEDPQVNISEPLEANLTGEVTVARFHSDKYPQGWFNVSIDPAELFSGYNRFYSLGLRGLTEGYKSEEYVIFKDSMAPLLNRSDTKQYHYTRTPMINFTVKDDFKIDISTVKVNLSNGTVVQDYYYENMTCIDLWGNQSEYRCTFMLNQTENGTYNMTFEVYDVAGFYVQEQILNFTIIRTMIDISSVFDQDDITNDIYLLFNWTSTAGELDYYEFALGTEQYPDAGFNNVKDWNTSCDTLASCSQRWVNFTHDLNASDLNSTELKMITGTVYYLTVRAKNLAGEYGEYGTSDGILFIDQTPPQLIGTIDDRGPWSNDDSSLRASWTFEDNESDIIEYMYAVGTAQYPDAGWDSMVSPTVIGLPYVVNDGLTLEENETYYYNVKARNGNVAMNYSGSWSGWASSPGVQIDTIAPSGGFIYWLNQSYATSGFVTIQYDVGVDLPGTSNNVKGMIQVGRGPLTMDVCPSISDFDWYNNSDVLPSGSSYRDVNVSTGYCYVFRLYAWDNATNGVIYNAENETLRIVKADTTPPTDVAPVVDDGFYTNSRSSLHADWQDSSDPESGFEKYEWKIFMQPTALGAHCDVNRTDPTGTNCSYITGSNSTASEVSINNLNLTHNHKYFFEVRAWNKAGLNTTSRYSDGIIYIDNAPPGPLSIHMINEDNESFSPYLTKVRDGLINITAYGDLDGYEDIDNCVLLSDDIDYAEDGAYSAVLSNCTETRVWSDENDFTEYLTNSSLRMITKVFCENYTPSIEQDTFEWFISCRDPYWNTQSYAQNTLAWFTVDWPEPPKLNVTLGDMSLRTPVYADDTIYCAANITDSDTDPIDQLNTSNVTVWWFREGTLIATHYTTASDPDGNGVYEAVDSLDPGYTLRGTNITCNMSAVDLSGNRSSNVSSIVVTNTEPYDLYIVSPEDETVNEQMSFAWVGPYDDVDADFMTLEIWVDNESSFNRSNDPALSFGTPVQMTVEGSPISSTQQNPDIFEGMIVYEDTRGTAGELDIYMYDIETDEEIAISTASGDQTNPKIYNNYIAYEDGGDINLYNIDTSITTENVVTSITPGTMDMFGDYIGYHDGSNIKFRNINNLTAERNTGAGSSATMLEVYGQNMVWRNSDGSIGMYDMWNGVEIDSAGSGLNSTSMFGDRIAAVEDNGVIAVTHIINASDLSQEVADVICGESVLHAGLLACVDDSGEILLADIVNDTPQTYSLGVAGSDPAIYDTIVVYESGTDLYYATRNITLPARWQVEQPYSASYVYRLNTTFSTDDTYTWKIQGCDNAFRNNSCVWGKTLSDADSADFTIDNTAPTITGISPADGSIVAGQFRIYAKIEDEIGDVTYANYTVRYANDSTIRASGDMELAGLTWKSEGDALDFLDINVSAFTLEIHTRDFMDNWNSATTTFTVDNSSAWFLFGGRGGTEIIDSETVFDNTIDSDFVAFTVTTSTIKITGPYPKTTQRFIQSKNNLTITNHNYSDDISTLTWPDGLYTAIFTGTNLDKSTAKNMTFYVDHNAPNYYDNRTIPDGTVRASVPITLSINWTDATLMHGEVNITYNATSRNGSYTVEQFNATSTSEIFISEELDMSAFINQTFYWRSTARDGRDRTTSTGWIGMFVESDNPSVTGTLPAQTVAEDTYKDFADFELSEYFDDPNIHGDYAHLDNLTYNLTHNCSTNATFSFNATSGQVFNISMTGNFTGHCNVTANATDYYGKQNSTWFILDVTPVNDPPTFKAIPSTLTTEDDPAGIPYSLIGGGQVYDIDGNDELEFLIPEFDEAAFNLTQDNFNLTTGRFNFTLVKDYYGIEKILFGVTDGEYTLYKNATVTITNVNDAPIEPTIHAPNMPADRSGMIDITWTDVDDLDVDNATLWFSLEYSDDGTSWTSINNTIFNTSSYTWNSTEDIDFAENVTLRLNVTDNDYTNTTEKGNFTVDNTPPKITIIAPKRVAVGSSMEINVTTDEVATCNFDINSSSGGWTMSASEGAGTIHTQSPPGIVQNVTYNLTVDCTDDAASTPNQNVTSQLFELRANPLEFSSITPSKRWAYVGEELNLTLSVASNDTLSTITVNITAPSGTEQEFDETEFSPTIDEDNKESYLNGAEALIPSEPGQFTVQIILLDSPAVAGGIGPFTETNIFEVFTAINQTLNTQ